MSEIDVGAATVSAWALLVTVLVRRSERACTPTALTDRWATLALLPALAIGLIALVVRPLPESLVLGVVCVALVALAPADLRTGYLFDSVTLPTALAVVALSIWTGRVELATGGVIAVAGFFYALVALSRGRLMGMGDVKAIFALSAAFGPVEATLAIFVACCSGIAGAAVRRRDAPTEIPFGPHLAIGSCVILLSGPTIERTWMHIR